MTVLSLPFVGTKPDGVPLVDDVDHESTSTMYEPKLLEACGGHSSMDGAPDPRAEFKRSACKIILIVLILLAFAVALLFTGGVLCKAYHRHVAEDEMQNQWNVEEEDAVASIPCKTYTSYADAESDMLSMPPSLASAADVDYDAGQFDLMEIVYRKMKNPYDVISTPDEGYDFDFKLRSNPSNVIIKPTRFIHDFSINVTGIVDVDGKRCYVMPLLPGMVTPPQSMNELLFKMSSRYYSTDINKVIAQMTIIEPALADLSDYGLYISKDCADYPTYKLDPAGLNTKDIVFV